MTTCIWIPNITQQTMYMLLLKESLSFPYSANIRSTLTCMYLILYNNDYMYLDSQDNLTNNAHIIYLN